MEHEPVKVFDRVKMPAPLIFLAVVMIILLVGASNQLDNSQNFEKISKKAIINSYKKYSSKNNGILSQFLIFSWRWNFWARKRAYENKRI